MTNLFALRWATFNVVVPGLGGESVKTGKISTVEVKVGDAVPEDTILCMIESDKSTIEVRTDKSGIVKSLAVKEGDMVDVGANVAVIDEQPVSKKSASKKSESASAPAETTTTSTAEESSTPGPEFIVKFAIKSESVKSGKLAVINVKVGDYVAEDTILAMVETDKSSLDVRNDKSGIVKAIHCKEGDVVTDGQDFIVIEEKKQVAKKKAAAVAAPTTTQSAEPKTAEKKSAAAAPAATPLEAPVLKSNAGGAGSRVTRVEDVSMMRARIAQRLKASQNENALLTTFNEIDVTNLVNMRAQYKDQFEKKHGVKLGLMSPFLKAAAHALIDVPVINASFKGDKIEFRNFVDISVAVATPKGLVVPVMRNVEQMSYADIEKQLEYFAQKAKANKVTPDDMAGGTFTVSNGGTFGSWMGTPIVNPPQSAILGMHAIKKKPWVNEKDEIVVRQIMAVALTYDHRLIDGRDAVTFLVKIKNVIEDPVRLLLDLA